MKQKIVHREHSLNKFGLHLVSFVPFLPKPENINLLTSALNIFKQFPQLNDKAIVEEMFTPSWRVSLEMRSSTTSQRGVISMFGQHVHFLRQGDIKIAL